jgi:hypothetical protein
MSKVFVIHSPANIATARKLGIGLKKSLGVAIVLADDISFEWNSALRKAISEADAVVAIVGTHQTSATGVLQMLGAAWVLEKPIIPVIARRDALNWIPLAFSKSLIVEQKASSEQTVKSVASKLERFLPAHAA